MSTILLALHLVMAVVLIITILLQPGKGGDVGAAFGAGGSQTFFGPRGATTLLQKVTITTAILFLMSSIALVALSRRQAGSVIDSISLPASPTVPTPAGETPPAGTNPATPEVGAPETSPTQPDSGAAAPLPESVPPAATTP